MRTMLKVSIPVSNGNDAIKNETLPKIVAKFVETHKPECAYFAVENGLRTATFVLNVINSNDLPSIAEPFFMGLNAAIFATPCMNLEDLKVGIAKAAQLR